MSILCDAICVEYFSKGADWVIPAAGIGIPQAVQMICNALTPESIVEKTNPSSIAGFVQAIAAHDISLLVEITEHWPRPAKTQPLRWTKAWWSCLRHLKRAEKIARSEVDFSPLSFEAALIWDRPPQSEITWDELRRLLAAAPTLSDEQRIWRRATLKPPFPSVKTLLASPVEMLFLLKGYVQLLPAETRDFIQSTANSCLVGDLRSAPYQLPPQKISEGNAVGTVFILEQVRFEGNIAFAYICFELCREMSADVCENLSNQLAKRLPDLMTTRDGPGNDVLLPLVLTTDWSSID